MINDVRVCARAGECPSVTVWYTCRMQNVPGTPVSVTCDLWRTSRLSALCFFWLLISGKCGEPNLDARGGGRWYGTVKIATFYAPDVVSGLASKVSGSMAMAIFRYTLVAV